MAKEKLADVMEHTRKPVTNEEAQALCKIGMSMATMNDKARAVLMVYLEHTLAKPEISTDEVTSVLNVLQRGATTNQKDLCDKIVSKYLSKFDGLVPVKPVEHGKDKNSVEMKNEKIG